MRQPRLIAEAVSDHFDGARLAGRGWYPAVPCQNGAMGRITCFGRCWSRPTDLGSRVHPSALCVPTFATKTEPDGSPQGCA